MTYRPNVIKKRKNNAWVCKVLPIHWTPIESHVRPKSSTLTESLSNGRLPLMQLRADLIIKNDSLHMIKLTTSSYLWPFLELFWKQDDDEKISSGTFTTYYRKKPMRFLTVREKWPIWNLWIKSTRESILISYFGWMHTILITIPIVHQTFPSLQQLPRSHISNHSLHSF